MVGYARLRACFHEFFQVSTTFEVRVSQNCTTHAQTTIVGLGQAFTGQANSSITRAQAQMIMQGAAEAGARGSRRGYAVCNLELGK